jgi:hypothetical protein
MISAYRLHNNFMLSKQNGNIRLFTCSNDLDHTSVDLSYPFQSLDIHVLNAESPKEIVLLKGDTCCFICSPTKTVSSFS